MENTNGNSRCNYLRPVPLNPSQSHQFSQSKNLAAQYTVPPQTQMHGHKSGLVSMNCSKSKSCKALESTVMMTSRIKKTKLDQKSMDDSARILVRSQSNTVHLPRGSRSANTSPSAWALSPGRSLHPPPMPPSLHPVPKSRRALSTAGTRRGSSSIAGVSVGGVLKYLSNKIKKVSPALEEEHHQFRLMHTRLLQWRFVNAQAELSMTSLKRVAQKKLFNAWLKMSTLINFIVEKRSELQRFKQEIKLYRIISSELRLLREWGRMESKSCEAVGRLASKLSAISICFPLVEGAEGDIASFLDAITMASKVVDDIETVITKIEAQTEQVCFLLTELSVMVKEHKDCVNELETVLAMVASLEAQETSLRVHCMELSRAW